MKKDNFEDLLAEVLKEDIIERESAQCEQYEKVVFSKEHERRMEEIFNAVENGELGNFRVEKTEEVNNKNKLIVIRNNRFVFSNAVKVAIFILLALVVSLTIAPGMMAWRNDELNLYGDNKEESAWILPNDVSEMLDESIKNGEKYLKVFGYLPEGAKIESIANNNVYFYIKIKFSKDEEFVLRVVYKDNNYEFDIENSDYKVEYIDSFKVFYTKKDEINTFVWSNKGKNYRLYGQIMYEEIVKIIQHLNYEEIDKIL